MFPRGTIAGGYVNPPWYDRLAGSTIAGQVGPTTISAYDTPWLPMPVTFQQLTQAQFDTSNGVYNPLTYIYLSINFTTDVAAQTKDMSNGANNFYLGEAGIQWTFNGNGNVDSAPDWTWHAGNGAGVTRPTDWITYTSLTQENTNPPIFNTLLTHATCTWTSGS
jgi:hypothetical protein